jgi:hypothetical protein
MTIDFRDPTLEEWKARLEHWGAMIDVLETRAHRAKAHLRADARKQIASLRTMEHALSQRLVTVEQTKEAWHDAKAELRAAWVELTRAFERAAGKVA